MGAGIRHQHAGGAAHGELRAAEVSDAFCQPVAQGFAVIALVGDEFGGGRHGFDTALGDLAIMDVSWCQEQDEGPAFRIADSVPSSSLSSLPPSLR